MGAHSHVAARYGGGARRDVSGQGNNPAHGGWLLLLSMTGEYMQGDLPLGLRLLS
jgi:hypothetical protein